MHALPSVKSNLAFCLIFFFPIRYHRKKKKTTGFTKMGMPAGAELSVFEKPGAIFYVL
jgi:hypothetical protein